MTCCAVGSDLFALSTPQPLRGSNLQTERTLPAPGLTSSAETLCLFLTTYGMLLVVRGQVLLGSPRHLGPQAILSPSGWPGTAGWPTLEWRITRLRPLRGSDPGGKHVLHAVCLIPVQWRAQDSISIKKPPELQSIR